MLACVQRNEPLNQIKTVNVPSTSTLNASADEYQPRASNIQTVSRSENNIKYSPSVLIELLDGNGMWRKAVALLDSGSDVKARFHYERGKKHSLFVLLLFFALASILTARFNRRSIKERKNALFHARSGNGPLILQNEILFKIFT